MVPFQVTGGPRRLGGSLDRHKRHPSDGGLSAWPGAESQCHASCNAPPVYFALQNISLTAECMVLLGKMVPEALGG